MHRDDPWDLGPPEPTNLIALWPGAEPPAAADFARRWSAALDVDVTVRELEGHDPAFAWCAVFDEAEGEPGAVAWVEPARPLPPDEMARLGVDPGRWVVGVEAALDPDDPLTAFTRLLRGLAVSLPEAPAILDVNTTRWHARPELAALRAAEAVEPAADVLWVIQAVRGVAGGDDENAPTWLHTHGLARCGAPELEMIGVPAGAAAGAAEVLSGAAALLLEPQRPGPGGRLEIGAGLHVLLRPWEEVAASVPAGVPGAVEGRDADAHAGARAVLCAAADTDESRSWPQEVVRRVTDGVAAVYVTARETARRTSLARAGWSAFVTAAHGAGGSARASARFAIEARFGADDDAAAREHLWLEVDEIEADRVRGRVVHAPSVVSAPGAGDQVWITPDRVTDWRVFTPAGMFGPADAGNLPARFDGR